MLKNTHSILGWSDFTKADPERAAISLLENIASIDATTRNRVFAALPSKEELTQSFEASVSASGPLAGVPFFLKDLFDFPGYQTTASSSFLDRIRPSPETESDLSQSIRAQGGVFAGKTHLNEFAYGLSGENPTFGDCPHPLFPEKLSGGSSSGSAYAVRSGLVPIATGTDTGGSIRVPAAWCGIYGLRLSPNNWSTQGCFPLAPTFDTAGWFCATASDMALSISSLLAPQTAQPKSLRGVSLLDSVKGLSPEFRAKSLDTLEQVHAHADPQVQEAYRMATKSVAYHYSVLQSLEALEVHKTWLDKEEDNYDPVVYQRIERARHWSAEQIEQAHSCEAGIKSFFETCFEQYDFVALPATQSPAISAAEHTDKFRSDLLGITAPGSFARCPVLTIPIHLSDGTSQGIQILYKENDSDLPLRVLKQLEA